MLPLGHTLAATAPHRVWVAFWAKGLPSPLLFQLHQFLHFPGLFGGFNAQFRGSFIYITCTGCLLCVRHWLDAETLQTQLWDFLFHYVEGKSGKDPSPLTYTYTYTHTHVHTYTHTYTHILTYTHIHTHIDIYIHIHTHIYTHITHTYTHNTCTHIYTCIHIDIIYTYAYTTYAYIHT